MSSTFTFVIDHPVSNGTMTFDLARDEWVVYGRDAVTIDRIDANEFKTIREFKEWAHDAITKSVT